MSDLTSEQSKTGKRRGLWKGGGDGEFGIVVVVDGTGRKPSRTDGCGGEGRAAAEHEIVLGSCRANCDSIGLSHSNSNF